MLSAEEANRQYFREAYGTGEHGWEAEKPSPCGLEYLARVAKVVPGGRLLDVGCGEGRHCFAAARAGFQVIGVDYEPLALQRAREAARRLKLAGVTFRRANVFSLPFPEAYFDVLLDYGCLHHQRKADWAAYRRALLRVLKPGGFYLLSVFSPHFRMFRGRRRPWHIAYGAYRRCFTLEDIRALYGRDFEVLEAREERDERTGLWHLLMRRKNGNL